jgi:hypothetical protein
MRSLTSTGTSVRSGKPFGCSLKADMAKYAASQIITSNIYPQINAELLLLSSLGDTMMIVLRPLVVVVKIDDAVSVKICLV